MREPMPEPTRLELTLAGPAGEPVDLWRAIVSHGLVELPPMRVDEERRLLEVTLPMHGRRPRTVRISEATAGRAVIEVLGRAPGPSAASALLAAVRHVLRLDEDLSGFYAVAATDLDLAWATRGAGRMVRGPTVFEDVVKTICTTNCSWSATERMVGALVEHLGAPAAGAPATGSLRRAFPAPAVMATAGEQFYAEQVRAGYRGRYLRELSAAVAEGGLDLEELADPELPEGEVEQRLLALPGVGPYAAAHVMVMSLGRYSKLILDSWTRPMYARLHGGRRVSDAGIVRRFRRYGPFAGLAFWLTVTRDWA
jgi:3-methyladenine DNA glycosylase/8-oxoguanine DNA glycosylase